MDNKTTSVKLCFDGSIHRVVIRDRTLSALRDIATQLFAGVPEFSYINGDGEVLSITSDAHLKAAIENAHGVPKLSVTNTECATKAMEANPLPTTERPDRWAARINKMPRWRLEKMLHTKSKKLAECSNAESRAKLAKTIAQLEEAIALRPEDERDKGAHDKLKSMSRFRLEKMLHRKSALLSECTGPRAERISAAIAAISSELATREPADESEPEAKPSKKAKAKKAKSSKKSDKIKSDKIKSDKIKSDKIKSDKSSKKKSDKSSKKKSDKSSKKKSDKSSKKKSDKISKQSDKASTKKQTREDRWNDKLHAMPRFRLEKMLHRKSEKLAECPERGDRLANVIAAITSELAARGPEAQAAEAKRAKRSRKCSKVTDTQTVA
jgi:hypothetical protein